MAGPFMLLFLASCDEANTKRQSAATAWQRTETVYFHQGVAAGPVLTTNADGTPREERRYEPFGQPVSANLGGTAGSVDFRREQQNSLGKLTNPNTGWSYHGARWMQPQAARWTTPDPATKALDVKQLDEPWDLNPYAYVSQMPSLFWDPDGLAKSIFFYGAPLARDETVRRSDGTQWRYDQKTFEPALRAEMARKTNSRVDEVTMVPFSNAKELQDKAAVYSKNQYDIVGTFSHGVVNMARIAPDPNPEANTVKPKEVANAFGQFKGVKKYEIWGCDTLKNDFALGLSIRLDQKKLKVPVLGANDNIEMKYHFDRGTGNLTSVDFKQELQEVEEADKVIQGTNPVKGDED